MVTLTRRGRGSTWALETCSWRRRFDSKVFDRVSRVQDVQDDEEQRSAVGEVEFDTVCVLALMSAIENFVPRYLVPRRLEDDPVALDVAHARHVGVASTQLQPRLHREHRGRGRLAAFLGRHHRQRGDAFVDLVERESLPTRIVRSRRRARTVVPRERQVSHRRQLRELSLLVLRQVRALRWKRFRLVGPANTPRS